MLQASVSLLCCRIILENSGVAEPQNIRDAFNEAMALGNPITSRIYLDTLVTVVSNGLVMG
jgi:G3E family GTPase